MKKHLLVLLLSVTTITILAQVKTDEIIKKNGLTLEFKTNVANLSPVLKQRLTDAFFEVYPLEVKRFNPKAATTIVFDVDTAYKGVAATSAAYVRFNPEWFNKHPEDIDVVTHEVMHIVQNYGSNNVPGWLTEGIADYARYIFGINNEKSGWKLTEYKAGQNYTNSYRITARFLVWAEKYKDPNLVNQLDKAMRAGTYTPELWKQFTGQTVDELWAAYVANPVI